MLHKYRELNHNWFGDLEMIYFYGELTKNLIIVITKTSNFLLINQNATWKACAWHGQKRPKAKAKTTTKKRKNGKEDDTSVSSQDNNTNTSKTSSKHNKNAPLEVQQQPSSAESDSSGEEEDDSSDDELEIQEPPNKKSPERMTVSQKPLGKKKSNNSVMDKKDDDNNMDNYDMFIDDAPIDNLPGNLKPFIKNVIDNKLFSMVKFISCPSDAKNLMGLVFFKIKWHGNSMGEKWQRTLHWAAGCKYITTCIADLRQYAYDRWYHIYSRKY